VSQISAPAPVSVKVPFEYVALPAIAGDPMSPLVHGVGSVVPLGGVTVTVLLAVLDPAALVAVMV